MCFFKLWNNAYAICSIALFLRLLTVHGSGVAQEGNRDKSVLRPKVKVIDAKKSGPKGKLVGSYDWSGVGTVDIESGEFKQLLAGRAGLGWFCITHFSNAALLEKKGTIIASRLFIQDHPISYIRWEWERERRVDLVTIDIAGGEVKTILERTRDSNIIWIVCPSSDRVVFYDADKKDRAIVFNAKTGKVRELPESLSLLPSDRPAVVNEKELLFWRRDKKLNTRRLALINLDTVKVTDLPNNALNDPFAEGPHLSPMKKRLMIHIGKDVRRGRDARLVLADYPSLEKVAEWPMASIRKDVYVWCNGFVDEQHVVLSIESADNEVSEMWMLDVDANTMWKVADRSFRHVAIVPEREQ